MGLVALLALLALAACGGSESSEEGNPGAASSAPAETAADENAQPPEPAATEPPSELVEASSDTETHSMEDAETGEDEHAGAASEDGHAHGESVEAPEGLAVSLEAIEDSRSGYNLRLTTENFTFAPEHAGGEHVPGEGHAHVYVDGEKLGRIYGEWFHLDNLEPGAHDIRVTLNANTHADYATKNETIAASVRVGEEADQASKAPPEPAEPELPAIVIENGEPVGGVTRIEAKNGDRVAFTVRSDIPDEVHVHGFDVTKAVTPGRATTFRFKAEFEGIFEVEAHEAGDVVIAKVVVSP